MQKKTKGIIAGAAGGAILLGTAGTFALWNVERNVPGAAVTGGTFSLSAAAIDWQEQTPAGVVLDADADEAITLVPGVQLAGTSAIDAQLAGDHLVARLTTKAGTAAPDWLDVTWKLGSYTAEGAVAQLVPTDSGAKTLSVTIQLKNQDGTPDGSDVAGKTWNSGDFTIALEQVAPPAVPAP